MRKGIVGLAAMAQDVLRQKPASRSATLDICLVVQFSRSSAYAPLGVHLGLLAYILVLKFDDHIPLCRLNEIFARMGADIPGTVLGEDRPRRGQTVQWSV